MISGKDPETGRFVSGNTFWQARSTHGRKPLFETADMLRDAIEQYFQWNVENPLLEHKLVSFQGQSTVEQVPKMRAMTIAGMGLFLGITRETWSEWKQSRSDFSDVIAWAEQVIYSQKFEGAAADMLNPNIIARDLGLADKKDLQSSDGTMTPKPAIDVTKLSQEAMAEILAASDENDQQ